ncbi:MAG: PASTA domain-containing protein [Ruminococcaceae bacterium]|nr:PASTA domain-containing protein [Oscillospiraceae bacterium]
MAINQADMKRNSLTAKRGVILLCVFLAVLLIALVGRLGFLTIVKGEEYRVKAENQQYNASTVASSRGAIYDSNMNVIAQTASVWLIYVNPSKVTDKNREDVIRGLVDILGVDEESLRKNIAERSSYGYYRIKSEVEYNEKTEIMTYAREKKITDVIFNDPDTKRYYPDGTLASTVIGFTGSDGYGLNGLEYYYDDALTGVDGKIYTLQDGNSNDLENGKEVYYEPVNGENHVLTLNNEIQTILRSACLTALKENGAENVYGVVMNTKTGAVLGMCNVPDYDSNDPFTIADAATLERIEAIIDEEEKDKAISEARYSQWKNKAVADYYYPGSVYKVFLVAGAMEEGVINENTSYTCHGTISVGDRTVKDYNPIGHGAETPLTLLVNSCNTFSVYVGQQMGIELFYKYFDAFGFTEKTGVDLPGETTPVPGVTYHSPDVSFTNSNLVSVSFGQSNQVTPMQIATAVSAIGNGGKLMTPYIVKKTVDDIGNTINETVPQVKRQVVSESTAKTVASYMEEVVKRGTGANAYVAGYHVAGKTGTSEKTGVEEIKYIASFAGFAPCDDPEITVVIIIDAPSGAVYSGGDIAAPVAGEVFEKVLPYLGVEPSYTESELAKLSEPAPELVGMSVSAAKSELAGTQHSVRVIGNGDTVVSQSPEAGRTTPSNGVIVLYTEENIPEETAQVPDFSGMTVSQANQLAVSRGFNIKISGSSFSSSSVIAYKQEYSEGTELEIGSSITVYFRTSGISD